MKQYELTLLLPGGVTVAKKKSVTETIEKLVKMNKGAVVKSEDWGEKDLAYAISKNEKANFLYFDLEMEPPAVKAVNDKLRMEDGILRHLLVSK